MDIIIEGDRLNDREEAHDYLSECFHFPEYYGRNLDALYDLLTEISEPMTIRIMLPEEEMSDYGHQILDVFEDAAEGCGNLLIEMESI